METVPESRSMVEFRNPAVPALRLKDSSFHLHNEYEVSVNAPSPHCRPTNPTPISVSSPLHTPIASYLSRNSAALARGQLRSNPSNSRLAPPPISRAQSMPVFNSTGHILAAKPPASPRSSNRIRSPKKFEDEVFIGLPNRNPRSCVGTTQSSLDKDDQTPRAFYRNCSPMSLVSLNNARPRRPASPRFTSAQFNAHISSPTVAASTSSPTAYSPRSTDSGLGSSYCYSGSLSYPGSFSIPTTPTSTRSRSPSISSLETIPDSPDAEEAALEAERLTKLKIAAEASDHNSESKPKISQDIVGNRSRPSGPGFSRDKRKRWSVCGAERRGDLNLDTIWED